MNIERVIEFFFEFSYKVLAYVINLVYFIVLTIPLYLIGLLVEGGLIKYAFLFIPLTALFLVGLKNLVYTSYMILIKKKLYYKPFFWKSLTDDFFRVYSYYLIVVSLLYFGLTSTYFIINTVSQGFWVLFALICLLILPNIVFTTLQFALYEPKPILQTIKNSYILFLMLGVVSLAMTILLGVIIYLFLKNLIMVTVLMPLYSALYILIYLLIDNKRLKKDRGNYV
ncbi:hypothetical protein ACWOAQ_01175 [Helcococcus kunzii]|uniref:hypothetical protein n=1 Tax=Helcococcus kunzii TaxID=40091 RepID=UPI001BAE845C|nr:hypothetical protein [Helcococcus kunzii]QUY64946.1 EscU/YscU/HrcU family type III secretion system export apparatus switch protein [Helcococcus kunzii]